MADPRHPDQKAGAPDAADELRRAAEERIDGPSAEAAASPSLPIPEDLIAAVHELRVHQIELEMQNEELRRAQLEVGAQRAKYFELFDLAPVGYLTISAEGIVDDANLTAVLLLGVQRQLLVGQRFSAFVLAADRDVFYLQQRRLRQTKEPQTCELRLRRVGDTAGGGAGGEAEAAHFWARLEARPQGTADGETPSLLLTFSDVAEHKRDEQALQESDKRLREAQRLAHVGSWLWELATDTVRWSEELYRVSGRDPSLPAPSYAEMSSCYTPESWARLSAAVAEALRSGQPYELDVEMVRPDGTARQTLARGEADHDAGGRVVGLHGTVQDITERKRAHEALLESESRFRTSVNVSPVPLAVNDEQQHITFLNPAFVTTFGYTQEDIPTLAHWWPRAYPDPEYRQWVAAAWQAELENAKRTGAAFSPMEVTVRCKDGTIKTVLASATPFSDSRGGNHFVVLYDITERKQAEAEVQRLNAELEQRVIARTAELGATNKELEAFVYSASHDLRAPLRAIDGFSQMVIEDAAERLDATDVEHLQRVRAAAQRMGRLIDGLLALSHSSHQDLVRERVDLSALAASVLEDLRKAGRGRQVEAVVQPDLVADADAALLEVILTNLLGNAWKFTSRHETACIEVGVTDADGERAFYAKDDGAGFDVDAAEHLFGAFRRFHATEQFEGDGIGLATVKRLVARHGGRVWAEAKVEQGATFFFTLPEAPDTR